MISLPRLVPLVGCLFALSAFAGDAGVRRRARHLVGYGSTPVLIRPGKDGIPRWEVRDPLTTYPAPSDPDGVTSMKFMDGLPIKPATKRFVG